MAAACGLFLQRIRRGTRRSSSAPRVVRVGTHALKENGSTVLWTRLSQHRGRAGTGSGNHRGSIFRLIVGKSLIAQRGYEYPTWGNGNNAAKDIRAGEVALECEVSDVIGAMPVLWLGIDDDAGPGSLRGFIERNAIALLSNYRKASLDPPSSGWLGHHCDRSGSAGQGSGIQTTSMKATTRNSWERWSG